MVAHDIVKGDTALPGETVQLIAKHDVFLAQHTVDEHDVTIHLFGQGSDGSDPDTTGDERHLLATAGCICEVTEWPLGHHARSRPDGAHVAGEIANIFDGDA